jgi:hypothetical protein
MKMNNQEIERFEHHVGDMYNILMNISTELNTIKVKINTKNMFRVTILKHTIQVINKMNTIKVTNAKNIIKGKTLR